MKIKKLISVGFSVRIKNPSIIEKSF